MALLNRSLFGLLFVVLLVAKEADLFKLPTVAKDKDGDDVNLKIVNGDYAEEHQFPYQVYIQTLQGGGMAAACGGTIISEKFIVTAAHCVYQNGGTADPSKVSVFVGTNDVSQVYQNQVYQAANVHTHPNYDNKPPYHSDIAIIELANPIQFGDGVDKACLNYQDKTYDYLIASGYGLTSRPKTDAAGNTVNNPAQGNKLKYGYFKEDKSQGDDCQDNFICIISYDGENDSTCEGDSGGPLSTPPDSDGKMQVLGATSNGSAKPIGLGLYESCMGDSKFTRFSTFSSYIDDIVGADNYCAIRA